LIHDGNPPDTGLSEDELFGDDDLFKDDLDLEKDLKSMLCHRDTESTEIFAANNAKSANNTEVKKHFKVAEKNIMDSLKPEFAPFALFAAEAVPTFFPVPGS